MAYSGPAGFAAAPSVDPYYRDEEPRAQAQRVASLTSVPTPEPPTESPDVRAVHHNNLMSQYDSWIAGERDPATKATLIAQKREHQVAFNTGMPPPDFSGRALHQQGLQANMAVAQSQANAYAGRYAAPVAAAESRAAATVDAARLRAASTMGGKRPDPATQAFQRNVIAGVPSTMPPAPAAAATAPPMTQPATAPGAAPAPAPIPTPTFDVSEQDAIALGLPRESPTMAIPSAAPTLPPLQNPYTPSMTPAPARAPTPAPNLPPTFQIKTDDGTPYNLTLDNGVYKDQAGNVHKPDKFGIVSILHNGKRYTSDTTGEINGGDPTAFKTDDQRAKERDDADKANAQGRAKQDEQLAAWRDYRKKTGDTSVSFADFNARIAPKLAENDAAINTPQVQALTAVANDANAQAKAAQDTLNRDQASDILNQRRQQNPAFTTPHLAQQDARQSAQMAADKAAMPLPPAARPAPAPAAPAVAAPSLSPPTPAPTPPGIIVPNRFSAPSIPGQSQMLADYDTAPSPEPYNVTQRTGAIPSPEFNTPPIPPGFALKVSRSTGKHYLVDTQGRAYEYDPATGKRSPNPITLSPTTQPTAPLAAR